LEEKVQASVKTQIPAITSALAAVMAIVFLMFLMSVLLDPNDRCDQSVPYMLDQALYWFTVCPR